MTATDAYRELIAAAWSLTGTEILAGDAEPLDGETDQFLSVNREALERARQALWRRCQVPLRYEPEFFEKQCENYRPLRNLARSFAIELRAAVRTTDLTRAVDNGLDIFHLANAVRRGGLVTDVLVAISIEGIAIDQTRRIRRRLKADQATRLANELLRIEADRESFEAIAARDRDWEEAVDFAGGSPESASVEASGADKDGIDEQTLQAVKDALKSFAELPAGQHRALQKQLDVRNLAMIRLLALESALIGCHGRTGAYPSGIETLVPDYIIAIPTDPFTGAEFRYAKRGAAFVVYSPGPTGRDCGGSFGDWLGILAGDADLSVDVFDNDCDSLQVE